MRSKRVILDTNLWIKFLISNDLSQIDEWIHTGRIRIIFSNELIEEFMIVARRSKFRRYFSDADLKDLLMLLGNYGILVKVTSRINECRDGKDNFLLSLAVDGKADLLVTGDSDLLILKKIKNTKIVKWDDFLKEIK